MFRVRSDAGRHEWRVYEPFFWSRKDFSSIQLFQRSSRRKFAEKKAKTEKRSAAKEAAAKHAEATESVTAEAVVDEAATPEEPVDTAAVQDEQDGVLSEEAVVVKIE